MDALHPNHVKKQSFTSISIIYNPNSTGDGKAMAEKLKADLSKLLPKQKVELMPTKHAGHGEQLAYKLATATQRPLIISASGDGGYHEVVNGIMRAQQAGARAVAGLLPAGNANDHYQDSHVPDVAKAIATGQSKNIDLIQLAGTIGGKEVIRYAHSYIGFGLTPQVGKELNKVHLNWFMEVWIVTKALLRLRPVRIIVNGEQHRYDSLVFSNIGKMSKYLKLSDQASNCDGKFEITVFKRHHKLKLILELFKASTQGISDAAQATDYQFKTQRALLVQVDGEISTIDGGSKVAISIQPKKLCCIV